MNKPNLSQRSWSDYTGKKPIKAWADKGFYDGSPPRPPGDSEPLPEVEDSRVARARRRNKVLSLQDALDQLSNA